VARHQPAKLAAMEGHFHTGEGGTELFLVGWPDTEAERTRGVSVPGGLSFLVYREWDRPVPGLDRFKEKDRPPVLAPFLGFHLMVGAGVALLALSWAGLFFLWRGTLWTRRRLLWLFVFAVLLAYAANQAGWVTAEVGRQPFIVYPEVKQGSDGRFDMETGGMRTAQGLSNRKVVESEQVAFSIAMFGVIYALLFAVWVYVLNGKIQHGPEEETAGPQTTAGGYMEAAGQLAGGAGSLTAPGETGPRQRETEAGERGGER
jgi:cytochrome d ubiquinol oxidase subunit I